MNWFVLSILAALFWGFENFLYKVSAQKGFNSTKITTVFGVTGTALSLLLFFMFKENMGNVGFLLLIALLNAVTFFSSVITRFEALKRIEISVFYPINKTGALFLMIILSYIFLKQHLTALQIVGLLVTMLAIYLLTTNKKKDIKHYFTIGLLLTFASTLFAALANFTLEFVRSTFSFTLLSYGLGFIITHLLGKLQKKRKENIVSTNNGGLVNIYSLGILIGILNFTGLILFIEALKTGPFSIVGAVTNFSLLITLSLGVIIFKERPTTYQIFGTLLSFLALILFKL